ncbi:hypothetical protein FGO68_gene1931 [Halteria grandinella]|uniref:Uncharacterized protein n=1 Tax=Halteria grandinella TaxID=5974 RepID=A0A8J8T0L7_HALGN|nr:hypothetical protein FGO68_gene1931 [Halteria grandinella]
MGLVTYEKRALYQFGKKVCGIFLSLWGLCILAGSLAKDGDMRAYYNLWMTLTPNVMHFGAPLINEEVNLFISSSNFEFQRFLNALSLLVSGCLLLSTQANLSTFGTLLGMLSVAYYALVNKNPLIKDFASSVVSESHSRNSNAAALFDNMVFIKCVGVFATLMVALVRGKIQYDEQKVKIMPSLSSGGSLAPQPIGASRPQTRLMDQQRQ